MKVTFLIPPVLDGTADVDRCFGCNYCIYFLPLLPILYAATLLKGEVGAVSIIDFPANKKTGNDFKKFIESDDSQVYVFYTVYLCQKTDLIARNMLRQKRRNAYFIFSGPQASYSPEAFLDQEDTFAVRGEPEFIIRELVRAWESKSDLSGIKGVSFRRGGKIVHNAYPDFIADIDLIPIPDRTMLDHKPYFNPKLHRIPHTAALTSRGCFGKCWFCVPNSLSYARELEHKKHCGKKPPPRLHSVERVIKEFTNIAALGFKSVSIIDDEFLWDEKRTCEICAGIKDLRLEWSCLARPDMVSERGVEAMARAGCAYVDMGTESFSREILADIKKDMRPEDTRRAVQLLKKYKIEVELNILFGASPKETEETIKYTIREAKRLDVDYVLFSITNPFPGTDFYCAAKKEGWMFYGDYIPVDSAKNAIISYPHLSKRKLEQLCSYAYLSYYLNPRYIIKQLLAIKDLKDLANKFSTFLTFLQKNFLKRC
jgi:radical SAM superfamily enzyme YgiQ (UPF0313 family)